MGGYGSEGKGKSTGKGKATVEPGAEDVQRYQILFPDGGWESAVTLLEKLKAGKASPGRHLKTVAKSDIAKMDVVEFVQALVRTKVPQIFAESDVRGDGSDWTIPELSILGDISVSVPVTIFDNGAHRGAAVHSEPFRGTLIYTCGALLNPSHRSADWPEVVPGDSRQLDEDRYFRMYERRLVPCFQHVNDQAAKRGHFAFVTVPGLGCGQFAGPFQGELGYLLGNVIENFLNAHGDKWTHITAVYSDAFREGTVGRKIVHDIKYIIQPLGLSGDSGKPQLCPPGAYEGAAGGVGDNFASCELFSFVAWDHVSWPGNDYWIGSRATDDGVKAAATDSMCVITGVAGTYDKKNTKYAPPAGCRDWKAVVDRDGIELDTSSLRSAAQASPAAIAALAKKSSADSTATRGVGGVGLTLARRLV